MNKELLDGIVYAPGKNSQTDTVLTDPDISARCGKDLGISWLYARRELRIRVYSTFLSISMPQGWTAAQTLSKAEEDRALPHYPCAIGIGLRWRDDKTVERLGG
jgi:hypothetical protein